MATHQQFVDALNKAWDALWALVSGHSQLITHRETQVHVEFAHLLMQELDKAGLVRWTDYRIYFDTPDSLRHTGVIAWRLVAPIRPDILIRAEPTKMSGEDKRGFAIEIKCLRSLADDLDEEFGILKVCDLGKQFDAWEEDLEKLQDVADSFGANQLRGVMLTLNYHELARGPVEAAFPEVKWDEKKQVSPAVCIQRSMKFFDGKIDPMDI